MTNEYTIGIFQTKDERKARRVLSALGNYMARYTYKEGWYEILVPERYRAVASELNRSARTLADTDLIPLPLQQFKEAA